MRFVLAYFSKLLPREGFKSLTIPALAFVLVFLINLMGGIKAWLIAEYDGMMDDYKITAEVSDLTGVIVDELVVTPNYLALFTDPAVMFSLQEFVDGLYLKRTLIVETLEGVGSKSLCLIGISAIGADETLDPESGVVITFFEGYDAGIFETNKSVCVVSSDIYEKIGTMASLSVRSQFEAAEVLIKAEVFEVFIETVETELSVVGTIEGVGSGLIYAPFQTVSALGSASDGQPEYSERLSVTLLDNRRLSEFKQEAWHSFSRVSPVFSNLPFAMTIYDSVFYDTVESLQRNIILVNTATPVIQFIAISIGFIASFLLTRRRKPEFALMQSVGIHKLSVFLGALLEQTALCTIGTLLGCLLALLAWQHVSVMQSVIFLGFYILGALFFATKAAGTDVLKILQDKE